MDRKEKISRIKELISSIDAKDYALMELARGTNKDVGSGWYIDFNDGLKIFIPKKAIKMPKLIKLISKEISRELALEYEKLEEINIDGMISKAQRKTAEE